MWDFFLEEFTWSQRPWLTSNVIASVCKCHHTKLDDFCLKVSQDHSTVDPSIYVQGVFAPASCMFEDLRSFCVQFC